MMNICVTNLGKYNEGELVFEWLTLPATEDEIQEVFDAIGINEQYEEYFLSDWECDFGIKISEYSSLKELNELAEKIEEYEDRKEELIAIMEITGSDLDGAISEYDNYHFVYLEKNTLLSDERNLAYSIEESFGGLENLGINLENYFDFKHFGRELSWDLDYIIDDWNLEKEEKEEIMEKSDSKLAEWWIYDILGGIDQLGQKTIESYIDYQSLGGDLLFDYSIASNGIAVSNY